MHFKIVDFASFILALLAVIIFVTGITDAIPKCEEDDDCPKHQCCLTAPTPEVTSHCSNFTRIAQKCTRRTPINCGCESGLKCQAHKIVKATNRLKMFAICEKLKKD